MTRCRSVAQPRVPSPALLTILVGLLGLVCGFAADSILPASRRRQTRRQHKADQGIPATLWAKIGRNQRRTDLYGDSFLLSAEGKFAELSEEFFRMVSYSWEELAGSP
jgi:hypothetical protein